MDMEVTVKGMIVEIEVQLSAEREAITSAQVRSINRMAELLSKRARLLALLSDAAFVGVDASQEKPAAKPSGDSPVTSEAVRPKASDFIIEQLGVAGDRGLSGAELLAAAATVGLTKGAVDKARTRLKEVERVYAKDGRWFEVGRSTESKAA
jgi:hypothetical protein